MQERTIPNPLYLEWQEFSNIILSGYGLTNVTLRDPKLAICIWMQPLKLENSLLVFVPEVIKPIGDFLKVKIKTIGLSEELTKDGARKYNIVTGKAFDTCPIEMKAAVLAYSITEIDAIISNHFDNLANKFEDAYKNIINGFKKVSP